MKKVKALLVGINNYADEPLRGCVNDVKAMKAVLEERHGAGRADIRLLTNKAASRAAILDGLGWLAEGVDKSMTCLFHYSGHGTRAYDESEDEEDGWDECLVPFDHWTEGLLVDDVLRKEYKRLDARTNLVLLMDCCHSGTVNRDITGEMRFRQIEPPRNQERFAKAAAKVAREKLDAALRTQLARAVAGMLKKDASEADIEAFIGSVQDKLKKQARKRHYGLDGTPEDAVLIAASRDSENAAEQRFDTGHHGALSYYLFDLLKSKAPTYLELIEHVAGRMEDAMFVQHPGLECNEARRGVKFLEVG